MKVHDQNDCPVIPNVQTVNIRMIHERIFQHLKTPAVTVLFQNTGQHLIPPFLGDRCGDRFGIFVVQIILKKLLHALLRKNDVFAFCTRYVVYQIGVADIRIIAGFLL